MKTKLYILLFCFFFVAKMVLGQTITAQTSGTANGLVAVYFADNLTGWAVGNTGTIRKTVDGGVTWTAQTSGTTNNLLSIDALSSTDIWVASQNGEYLTTTNGGTSWVSENNGTAAPVQSIFRVNLNTVYAVGGTSKIAKTTNAGASWTNQTFTNNFRGVHMNSTTTGWAVGLAGTILKTIDGATWNAQASGTAVQLQDVFFLNGTTGWVVGYGGTILKTTDGGTTWVAQTSPVANNLNQVHFVDANNGFAVGDGGKIIKTINGGTNWTNVTSGTTQNLSGIYMLSPTLGWIAGASGTILRYALPPDINIQQNAVNILDGTGSYNVGNVGTNLTANTVFTVENVGDATLSLNSFSITGTDASQFTSTTFVTTNLRGSSVTTFQVKFTPASLGAKTATITIGSNDSDENPYTFTINGTGISPTSFSSQFSANQGLNNLYFLTANTNLGWAVGDQAKIYKTSNAGSTWANQANTAPLRPLKGVSFADANTGWAVGLKNGAGTDGGLLKTTNGGTTWAIQIPPNGSEDIYAVFAINTNTAYAVATNKNFYFTNNGGTTWTKVTAASANLTYGMYFFNANTGFIVGQGGDIRKTTNAGSIWANSKTGAGTNDFYSIYFVDANTGWVVGSGGGIYKTINGGANWTAQTSGTANILYSVHFEDANNGYAAGANATLLKTTDGGTTWSTITTGIGNQAITSVKINAGTTWITTDGGQILKYVASPTMNLKQNTVSIAQNGNFNLGQTQVGNTSNTVFTIENLAGLNLDLTSFQINGTNSAEFSSVSWGSSNLVAGTNTTFQLNFSPTSIGQKTAFITIGNNDVSKNPYYFTIFATASTTLTGQITELGQNIASVNLTLSNGFTTVTDSNGFYTAFISSSFTGTITPSKANYSFTPANISLTGITTPQINQNFAGLTTYPISGTLAEAGLRNLTGGGVIITASNGFTTTLALGSPFYTVFVSSGFTGTVTASQGTGFCPEYSPPINFTNVLSAQTNQNFAGYAIRQITGTITESGLGLAAATINLNTGFSTVTDANGFYTAFTSSSATAVTFTPSKVGYAFAPSSQSLPMITTNYTGKNFTAMQAYSISGKITEAGVNLPNVTIALSNGFTTVSDTDGTYTIFVSSGFTGFASATLANYNLTPINYSYTALAASALNQNFAAATVHRLEGTISEPLVGGINGVTIAFSNGFTTITDSNGFYTAFISSGFSGTSTPSLGNYFFSATQLTYNNLNWTSPKLGQDFSGLKLYSVTGTISESGSGLANVTLSLSNGFTTISDSNGFYTAFVSSAFSGTITPSKPNYFFTPTNLTLTNVVSNQVNQNFTAQTIYQIVGTTTESGTALPNVTMTLTNGYIATSDANGFYTAFVSSGFTGTATPTKTNYFFAPANRNFTNVLTNQIAQNFTGSRTYPITGTVAELTNPLPNATVNVSNGFTTISDANGFYTAFASSGFSGTMTATLANYNLSPNPINVTNLLSNLVNYNFSGETLYQIRGTITEGALGLNAVALALDNGFTTVTDANGFYTAFISSGFTGFISANKTNYSFSPNIINFTNILANQNSQDFAASSLYQISGTMTENGTPLSNANINFSNGFSTVSDANGFYTAFVTSNFTGTATPNKAGYTFTPLNRNFTNVLANQNAQDFAGLTSYKIEGTVTEGGNPLPNANLNFSNGFSTLSDANGFYTAFVSSVFTGFASASKAGYTFTPTVLNFTSVLANQNSQNFAALTTYAIFGTITEAGKPLANATLTLSNGSTVTTNSNGFYQIFVSTGFSGTLTPSKANFTFSPINTSLTALSASQNINFSANNFYKITGTLSDANTNLPIRDAFVNVAGNISFTDLNGFYTVLVASGQSGRITANKLPFNFTPSELNFQPIFADLSNQNFKATLFGTVMLNGTPIPISAISGTTLSFTTSLLFSTAQKIQFVGAEILLDPNSDILESRNGEIFMKNAGETLVTLKLSEGISNKFKLIVFPANQFLTVTPLWEKQAKSLVCSQLSFLSVVSTVGLSVKMEILSGKAELKDGGILPLAFGTVELRFSQIGNRNFISALPLITVLDVQPQIRNLEMTTVYELTFGDKPLELPEKIGEEKLIYTNSSSFITISNQFITVLAAGETFVSAFLDKNTCFSSASQLIQISIKKAVPKITWNLPETVEMVENPLQLNAFSSAGEVQYRIRQGNAQIRNKELVFSETGQIQIEAFLPESPNFTSVSEVRNLFVTSTLTLSLDKIETLSPVRLKIFFSGKGNWKPETLIKIVASDDKGSFEKALLLKTVAFKDNTAEIELPCDWVLNADYKIRLESGLLLSKALIFKRNPFKPELKMPENALVCEGEKYDLPKFDFANFVVFEWQKNKVKLAENAVSEAGEYELLVKIGKCEFRYPLFVRGLAKLPISLGEKTSIQSCSNVELKVIGLPSDAISWAKYEWSNGSTENTISVSESGEYSVKVSAPNYCETTSQKVKIEIVEPNMTVKWNKIHNICEGEKLTLQAPVSKTAQAFSYVWQKESNGIWADLPNGTTPNQSLEAGKYRLLVAQNAFANLQTFNALQGCKAIYETEIRTSQKLVLDLKNEYQICKNSVIIDGGNQPNLSYEWTGENFSQKGRFAQISKVGKYTLKVRNESCVGEKTFEVKDNQQVTARFLAASETEVGSELALVNLSKSKTAEGKATLFVWKIGEKIVANGKHHKVVFEKEGTYTVSLSISNGICEDITSKTVNVLKAGGGRDEVQKSRSISTILNVLMYPNPNSGQFSLQVETLDEQPVNLYFYNSKGILIEQKEVKANVESRFSFEKMPSGVYLVRIQAGKDSQIIRFVKD